MRKAIKYGLMSDKSLLNLRKKPKPTNHAEEV